MQLSFADPHPALRPFITTYYLFEEDAIVIDDSQRADCGHLRLFLEGSGHQQLGDGIQIDSMQAMLMGPHTKASRFTVRGPLRFVGMSLRPSAWGGGLFNCEAADVVDNGCDGEPYLGDGVDALVAQLAAQTEIHAMAPLLDMFLISRVRPLPAEHNAVNEAIQVWLKSALFPDVDALYAMCKPSPRQVMRISNRYWGSPPKALARKYGALRTASAILSNDGAIPPEADAFYSDQSHLIREVRRVTGMTPRQLHTISNMIMRITLDESMFRELQPIA